jgi:murein DD-endopeptidase MepM/ murein hydrolase activator NlpD
VLPVAAFILRKKGNLKMRLNQLLTEKTRPRRLGLVMAAALACAAPLALAQGMLIKGAAAAPGAELTYSHAVLDKATLTSAFGVRTNPITGKPGWHNGTDLAAPKGSPVYAPAAGIVSFAGERDGYGNLVEVMMAGDERVRFGKLSAVSVAAGDLVKPGQIIGEVGTTGESTGPHLHFEVWHGDKPDDPQEEEGLVLADSLVIMSSSGAKAPVPPAAPAAPVAALSPERPEACVKAALWSPKGAGHEDWLARREAGLEANRQAGVVFDTGSMPYAVSPPAPYYPAEAVEKGLSGSCEVLFDLGPDGIPKNMAAACSDPVFEDSAAELKGARFAPINGPDGKPAEVKGLTYPLEYCIEG